MIQQLSYEQLLLYSVLSPLFAKTKHPVIRQCDVHDKHSIGKSKLHNIQFSDSLLGLTSKQLSNDLDVINLHALEMLGYEAHTNCQVSNNLLTYISPVKGIVEVPLENIPVTDIYIVEGAAAIRWEWKLELTEHFDLIVKESADFNTHYTCSRKQFGNNPPYWTCDCELWKKTRHCKHTSLAKLWYETREDERWGQLMASALLYSTLSDTDS